jgi:hypothetical protein
LLISVPTIEAAPALSSFIVIFLQYATGADVFNTVTVAVLVELFPCTSVTVMVTVFAPELAQVNAFGDTEKLAIPQASEEPLFTANESIATLPV